HCSPTAWSPGRSTAGSHWPARSDRNNRRRDMPLRGHSPVCPISAPYPAGVRSEDAAHGSGFSSPVSRRAVLGGLSLLPLAAAMGEVPAASADAAYRYLTPHQAAVLDAATRRLIPGPDDCPVEIGSPGAHEANG